MITDEEKDGIIQERNNTINILLHAIKSILKSAQEHPLYMPTATVEEIEREGGDAAFITQDIAMVAWLALIESGFHEE